MTNDFDTDNEGWTTLSLEYSIGGFDVAQITHEARGNGYIVHTNLPPYYSAYLSNENFYSGKNFETVDEAKNYVNSWIQAFVAAVQDNANG